jgi:hypothetical protein
MLASFASRLADIAMFIEKSSETSKLENLLGLLRSILCSSQCCKYFYIRCDAKRERENAIT